MKAADALRLTDKAANVKAALTATRPVPREPDSPQADQPHNSAGSGSCEPQAPAVPLTAAGGAAHGEDMGKGSVRTVGDPGGLAEGSWGLLVGTDPPEDLPSGASRRERSASVRVCWSGAPRASVPTCLCQGAVCSPTFSSRLWEATRGTCT